MTIITISNLKGGVGKSTTAVNLSYALSRMGKRVLVIDADPQANTTPFFARKNWRGDTLLDALTSEQSCICRSRYPRIDLICGDTALTEEAGNMYWFLYELREVAGRNYNYCIIDTRPAFENLTAGAVRQSDFVLTPVRLDNYCRDNLALVDAFLDTIPPEIRPAWGVVATMVDVRRRAQRQVFADLTEKHDYPFLNTCIRSCAAVENALQVYKPVYRHRSKCAAAEDYTDLAAEIVEMVQSGQIKSRGEGM